MQLAEFKRSPYRPHRHVDRLEEHLFRWAYWKTCDGIGSIAASDGVSYSVTFDDLCAKMDAQNCAKMDVLIEDMGVAHPTYKVAIHWRWLGLHVEWPRGNGKQVLQAAYHYLRDELPKKAIY
jgi:hypothetical protein